MNKDIILVCKSVWYYSQKDEDAFFESIAKIPSIIKFNGVRDELYLYMQSNIIPNEELHDLIALFRRYKINVKKLEIFLNEHNKEYFEYYKESYSINVYPYK